MREMSEKKLSPPGGGNKGEPQQGRPKNSKDKTKRDQKTVKPRTSAEIEDFVGKSMWAKSAQSKISDIITPAVLDHFGKKNLRSLSAKESESLEMFKFSILCSLDPHSDINDSVILDLSKSENKSIPSGSIKLYNKLVGKFISSHGSKPSVDDLRDIQVSVYAIIKK